LSARPASRRRFLALAARGAAAGAALLAAPLALARPKGAEWLERRLARALRSLVGDDAVVAAAALARPGYSRRRAVEHLLGPDPSPKLLRLFASSASLRAHLAEASRRDFREGRSLVSGSWILSETEVAVAVLLAPAAAA